MGLSSCGGAVSTTPSAAHPELDDIPIFPYELFNNPKYDMGSSPRRVAATTSALLQPAMLTGTTYRYKSAGRLVEELDILINQYGQKQIVFYDDNFCSRESGSSTSARRSWTGASTSSAPSGATRADNFPPDLVPILARAGFKHAGFGIETGVNRHRAPHRKGETVSSI